MYSRSHKGHVITLSIADEVQDDLLGLLISFNHQWRAGKKPSQATFKFDNTGSRLSDDPRFYSNVVWKFRYGMLGDISEVFEYVIRGESIDYGNGKTIDVTLFDRSSDAAKHSSGKNWGKTTSSNIARAMAKRYGFKENIEDSKDQRVFVQPANVSDLVFLRELADSALMEMFVDGSPPVLTYRAFDPDQSPKGQLVYEVDPGDYGYVLSFSPTIKSLGPESTGASKTDTTKGEQKKSEAEKSDRGRFAAVVVDGYKRSKLVANLPPSLRKGGMTTPASAGADTKKVAKAVKENQLARANKASSTHPFTASIVPGRSYTWGGLDGPLNGAWKCVETTNALTGTSATTACKWERTQEKPKKKSTSDSGKAEAGTAPVIRINGNLQSFLTRGTSSATRRK